jgi:hypothetical protein
MAADYNGAGKNCTEKPATRMGRWKAAGCRLPVAPPELAGWLSRPPASACFRNTSEIDFQDLPVLLLLGKSFRHFADQSRVRIAILASEKISITPCRFGQIRT